MKILLNYSLSELLRLKTTKELASKYLFQQSLGSLPIRFSDKRNY